MTAKDQLKIIAAGFTIIRERDAQIPVEAGCYQLVWKTNNNHEWKIYSRGVSKAARNRVKERLLADPKVVED
jgi:hypothetical protein